MKRIDIVFCFLVCSQLFVLVASQCDGIGVGDDCDFDAQCCSGVCSSSGTCCLADNAIGCQVGEDCCNGNCESGDGICHPLPCGEIGDPCSMDEECCGRCSSGTCCGQIGDACFMGAQCCSGGCSSGRTCCLADNAVGCQFGEDCCNGNCESGEGICHPLPCGEIDDACSMDTDCCSGVCSSVGRCTCVQIDDACSMDTDCCSGVCSSTGRCTCAGLVCQTKHDCCDVLGVSLKCQKPQKLCGGVCTTASCSPGSGSNRPDGAPCQTKHDCLNNKCVKPKDKRCGEMCPQCV